MNTSENHAVVLGGSLAGLLAARVLADHFEHVTLIERDVYTDNCETRRGIPQANHVHGLLVRGRQIIEELFPGVQDEMIAAGAPVVDMANEIAWFTRAGWGVRFPSELKVLAFTRPLLDLHVRRRLSQNPRIEILDNTDVLRLIPGASENEVAGVLICPRSSETDRRVAKELRADLVVDATGRASRAPRWLSELGYAAPEETIIDAMCEAEPLTPIKTHRATQNRVRRYDRAELPHNFLLLGDAVCAFNPVYGQGMTAAALGAVTLHKNLIEQRRYGNLVGLSRRFQKQLAKVNEAPWMLATGEDYRYRETEGGAPTARITFMHRYMDQVIHLSTHSVSVRRVLMRAFNILVPPTALFHPRVLFRVLVHGLYGSLKIDLHRSVRSVAHSKTAHWRQHENAN